MTTDIIKNNCDFDFYFNKTDITPTVLDGGDEIVLANWPNDKHIICNINNDIPIKIPSHPYVLVNRSVLCNCRIAADNHHFLVVLLVFKIGILVSCSSVVVSKHGLYAGGPGSIPTAVTTMTAAGGDAEHVSLNH